MPSSITFDEILTEAVNYFIDHGFNDDQALLYWNEKLANAARSHFISTSLLQTRIKSVLIHEYIKQVERGLILLHHPSLTKSTLQKIKPTLRQVLTNRIAASAALITLNREEYITNVVRRFTGWASSLPPHALSTPKREVRRDIKKTLAASLRREANIFLDQRKKLVSHLDATISQGQAIAAIWISRHTQAGYDYREEHKKLAKQSQTRPFLIRNSWAHRQGHLKTIDQTFIDQLDHEPGQLQNCNCHFQYIYNLNELPSSMRKTTNG